MDKNKMTLSDLPEFIQCGWCGAMRWKGETVTDRMDPAENYGFRTALRVLGIKESVDNNKENCPVCKEKVNHESE